MSQLKDKLLNEIRLLKVDHPRALDIIAKISRPEDCFGIGHESNSDYCKSCVVLVEYKGKKMPFNECCALFMKIDLVDKEVVRTATNDEVKPTVEGEVNSGTAEGQKRSGKLEDRIEIVFKLIQGGMRTRSEVHHETKIPGGVLNEIFGTLVEAGRLSRDKDGKKFIYTVK